MNPIFVSLLSIFHIKNTKKSMRLPGIEPESPRWQRGILPLDHKRLREWHNPTISTLYYLYIVVI